MQINIQSVDVAEAGAEGGEVGTIGRKAFKAAAYGAGLEKRFAEIKNAVNLLAARIPAEDGFLRVKEILKIKIAAIGCPLITAEVACGG